MSASRPLSPSATLPKQALDTLLDGSAGDILRRACWLQTLDQMLRPLLPTGAAGHVRLANVRDRRLILTADSAAWHTRLRLATPALLEAARTLGLDVEAIDIRVIAPTTTAPASTPRRGVPTGLQAALALLREAADTPAGHDQEPR